MATLKGKGKHNKDNGPIIDIGPDGKPAPDETESEDSNCKPLNLRQELVIEEYLRTGNKSGAYSKVYDKTSPEHGSRYFARLMRNPYFYTTLQQRRREVYEQEMATTNDCALEVKSLALGDGCEIYEVLSLSDPLKFPPINGLKLLTPGQRVQIQRIKVNKDGAWEINFHDKNKALTLLMKHLGMFDGQKLKQSIEEWISNSMQGKLSNERDDSESGSTSSDDNARN